MKPIGNVCDKSRICAVPRAPEPIGPRSLAKPPEPRECCLPLRPYWTSVALACIWSSLGRHWISLFSALIPPPPCDQHGRTYQGPRFGVGARLDLVGRAGPRMASPLPGGSARRYFRPIAPRDWVLSAPPQHWAHFGFPTFRQLERAHGFADFYEQVGRAVDGRGL